MWFASDAVAGAHNITATGSTIFGVVAWEVSGIRTVSPVDTATTLDDQPTTTEPSGPSIKTATDGEFVKVPIAVVENVVSEIHSGNEFTNDRTTQGDGWAHLTDPHAPAGNHQAVWDTPTTGRYCATSVAFFTGP